jgi:SNF2 family DNA or RNA helicase
MITQLGQKVLHKHQTTAINWMMEREADHVFCGGLLCDEMGLGKTITTIGHMINSPVEHTLILAPLAVIHQWTKAFLSLGKASPAIYEIKATKRWRLVGGETKNGTVYITNYDKLISNQNLFRTAYDRLICDEAHTIRNYKSKKYMSLHTIHHKATWLLTGTPIVNRTMDLSTLLALINNRLPPNRTLSEEKAADYMRLYALCRTTEQLRDTIVAALPHAPTIIHHRLPFRTEEEATFYRGIQGVLAAELQRVMDAEHMDMYMFLELLMRLRQISVHPQIYINAKRRQNKSYCRKNWVGDSTKTEAIVDILRKDSGEHGYVIFCQFKEEIALLQERLSKEECVENVLVYSGDMTASQRAEVITASETHTDIPLGGSVDQILQSACPSARMLPLDCCSVIQGFLGPRHTVILAQIHCAGTGINLQHMDRVIFTTPWWTAALMDQAAGRVLRLGQTRRVVIHHLALEEEYENSVNIDDYINERVEQKRSLCRSLLEAASHAV